MRQHYKPYCPIINDKPLYTLLQYPILLVVKSLFLLCEIQKLLLLQLNHGASGGLPRTSCQTQIVT